MIKNANYSLVYLVIIAFLMGCGDGESNSKEGVKSNMQVEGFKVIAESFNDEVVTTAEILANEQVELKAPIAGQVLEVYFKEGQKINKGDVLIRIDDRSWKAELIGVKSALETAQKEYDRKKQLLAVEGSSQEEIDNSFSALQLLKSKVEQLQVNIDLANVSAPFSGMLGMRNFSQGAFLQQGVTITTLTETNQLKVDFTLAQQHSNSIEIGKTILVLIEKDTLEAVIYAINPVINTNSRTINVRATLSQPKQKTIIPGTYAEVLVTTNDVEDALLIPTQAVVPSINEQTVYVAKNGKAVKKVVLVGNRTKDRIHVLEGISAGDTVITTGLLQVKDGMGVSVKINN